MLLVFDVHILVLGLFFGQWVSWSMEKLPSRTGGEGYGEVSSVHLYRKQSGKQKRKCQKETTEEETGSQKCFKTSATQNCIL